MNRTTKRLRAGTAIAAAVTATFVGIASPALAATPDSVVDQSKDGSATLHVVKLSNAESADHADGTQASAPASPQYVYDAGFTIYPVTHDGTALDLGQDDDWALAAQLAAGITPFGLSDLVSGANTDALDNVEAAADGDFSLSTTTGVQTQSTATDGTADFTGLAFGLYLVVETTKPADAAAPTAPFLVTVPLSTPTTGGATQWLYDVYVYPKNSLGGIQKTVDDATAYVGAYDDNGATAGGNLTAGTPLTYTITIDVPDTNGTAAGNGITKFEFADQLPSQLEDVTASAVTLKAGATALTTAGIAVSASNEVTYTTTDAADLAAINAASSIVVTITATADTAGADIENGLEGTTDTTASFNDGDVEEKVTTPTRSAYGTVTLTKFDDLDHDGADDNADTPIAGAEFQLYISTTGDFADAAAYEESGSPVTFVTDATGRLTVLLRYTDVQTSDPAQPAPTYWLVETKATDGHELLAQPIPVDLSTTNGDVAAAHLDLEQANQPKLAGFQLPLTGGFGTFVFYAVGGGIVALTVILLVVLGLRRRHEQPATA